jgi:hypothetical protein
VSVPILPPERIALQVQKRQATPRNGIARSGTHVHGIPCDFAVNALPGKPRRLHLLVQCQRIAIGKVAVVGDILISSPLQ